MMIVARKTMIALVVSLVASNYSFAQNDGIIDRLDAIENIQEKTRILPPVLGSGQGVDNWRQCKPVASSTGNGVLCGLKTDIFTLVHHSLITVTVEGYSKSRGVLDVQFAFDVVAQIGQNYRMLNNTPSMMFESGGMGNSTPFSTTQHIILEPGDHRIFVKPRFSWNKKNDIGGIDDQITLASLAMQVVIQPIK